MAQIDCKNVTLGYEDGVVVSGLDFRVNEGDYLCIVGENGSGKTTLMRALIGLIAPLSGTITTGDGLQKNEIGYLPQQTQVQRDFPASVNEIVLSGFQAHIGMRPYYTKEEKARADENLNRMGMLQYKNRCYRDLSGGQQQRVLLARALCATRKLLLLDEPVSGLDPVATAQMYELINDLHRDRITVIMVSHDVGTAINHATHILHVGERIFFGTREAYLKSATGSGYLMTERDGEK